MIRQSDHLVKLAYQFSFDANEVWNDPTNDGLRKLRPDPSLLFPGDILYIPDQDQAPVAHNLIAGATNTFVSPTPPTAPVSAKFVDDDPQKYASRSYTITELEQLTGLTTDPSGVLSFEVPVTLDTATVVFTDNGETHCLRIGAMDPIDTTMGVFKRLQNLGYIDWGVLFDADAGDSNLEVMRAGLRALKASSNAGASSQAPDPGGDAESDEDSSPGTAPPRTLDDAGLSDYGRLSDEMQAMLVDAHGY